LEGGVSALFGRAEKEELKFYLVLAGKHGKTARVSDADSNVLTAPPIAI
jgi:hypothetical protein